MSRAFRFRLAPVLKLRQHREDERKRLVAATLREIAALNEHKVQLVEQIEQQVEAMRCGHLLGSIKPAEVARHRYWLSHLKRNVLENEARVRMLQARLAQERADLAAAATQRRALDVLHDRQQARFQQEQSKNEQRQADEIAATWRLHTEPDEQPQGS